MGGAPARPSPPGVGFECKACRGQGDHHQQLDVHEVVGMNNDDDKVDSVDLPPLVAHDDLQ